MKLIYQDKYDIVDKNMSDSNVGARKKKSIRNHIFILNGIINEAIQKKIPLDIVIADYKQCFDSLWLEECVNDLYDAGLTDDKLSLIYQLNSKNQVAVKTPFGMTERKSVENIVLQGEVFGPLQCSVTVDTFGKECMEEDKFMYKYRGEVGVPPLAMVDDLACPALCGKDAVEVTSFINSKTNTKKLQFGVDKCHQLHVGTKKHCCPDLQIDNWGVEKKDEIMTGFDNLTDVRLEDHKLEKVGDIISADGSNLKNVTARKDKSIGINKQICSMLQEVCFGQFHFEVGSIFRESLLLSSILTNCEAWYGLKQQEVEILEKCDESLIRMFFETPCTTPKCMLYLELGVKPIRFRIMARRIMYLQYILQEEEGSLISRFFRAQESLPCKDDWVTKVTEDLESLEIYLTFDHIKEASQHLLKKVVEEAIAEKAFEYLINEKNKKEKGKVAQIQYKNHEIQEYLTTKSISNEFKKFLFSARSRMLDLATNYPNKYKSKLCQLCRDGESLKNIS